MKLIQALKQIKDLQRKAEDLRKKVKKHSAISSFETPEYTDQKKQIAEWIQAHSDILKEILRLRVAIQKTNILTDVSIEIGGKSVTKSIAEWIHRRRDLANAESAMWSGLSDRGLQEGKLETTAGDEVEVKVIRFYDPETRDKMIDLYMSEPLTIDAYLEITNAVTDLIES